MEEDYNSREFNSYSSVNRALVNQYRLDNRMPEKDYQSLYIKRFPLSANLNLFLEGLKKYGKVIRHSFKTYEDSVVILINFSSTQEAERALRGLNNTPPFKLEVQYAHKREHPSNQRENYTNQRELHSNQRELHSNQRELHSNQRELHSNQKEQHSNLGSKESLHQLESPFCEAKSVLQQGIGRGGMYLKSFDEAELKMRIVCDNDKRDVLCITDEKNTNEVTNQFGGARPRTTGRGASLNAPQSSINRSPGQSGNIKQVVPVQDRSFEYSDIKISSPYEPPSSHNFNVLKLPKLISMALDCQCCGVSSHLWCSSCKTPYCSLDCQSQDWPIHEKICRSKKTSHSSDSTLSDASHSSGCQERDNVRKENGIDTNFKPRSEPRKKIDFNGKSFSSESEITGSDSTDLKFDSKIKNNNTLLPQPLQSLRKLESKGIQDQNLQKLHESGMKPQASKNLNSVESDKPTKIFRYQDLKGIVLPETTEKVIVFKIESLTKFWIMRKCHKEVLSNIEKQISELKDKIPLSLPHVYDLAIALNKEKKLCRTVIKEVDDRMKISRVEFLDYGGEERVNHSNLYLLSEKLKDYPPLAITCKLSDIEGLKNSKEQIEHFKSISLSNEFKAYNMKKKSDVYELSLVNDEGLSMSSMLAIQEKTNLLSCLEQHNEREVLPKSSETARSLPIVANIYTELKKSMKLKVAPAITEHNQHYIYAVTNVETFQQEFNFLIKELHDLKTEDVSSKAKEGDIVAGFSIGFNSWYRCVILKCIKGRFLVRYIDYGNEEEIIKLKKLPSNVLSIVSRVMRCQSTETFYKESSAILKQTAEFLEAVVNSTAPDSAELLVQGSTDKYVVKCFPFYSDFTRSASKQVETLSSTPAKCRIKVPLISDLANCTLPSDKLVDVVFWHAEKDLYFCQNNSDLTRLDELLMSLQQVPDDELVSQSPAINELYCVKCSDGLWYRGSVKEVCQNGTFIVFFIDFGNSEEVSLSSLKYLPKECAAVPKLSIPVKIKNLNSVKNILDIGNSKPVSVKASGSADGGVQVISVLDPANVHEKLKSSSLQNESLSLESPTDIFITYFNDTNSTYYCHKKSEVTKIMDMQTKLQTCEEISLSHTPEPEDVCRAKSSDGFWYRGTVKSVLPGEKLFEIYFLDYGNTERIASTDVLHLPKIFESYPIFCIPFKVNGANFDQPNITVIGIGSLNGVQLVKLVLPKSTCKLSSLKVSLLPENIQSEVQFRIISESIFCHDVSKKNDMSKLNVSLQNCKSSKNISRKPVVDEILCIKSEDGDWYRGCVKAVLSEDVCNVFLIDNGRSEKINIKNMQDISEELLTFPIFSIPIVIQDRKEQLNLNENHIYTAEVIKKQENAQVIRIVNSCPIGALENRKLEVKAKYQVAFSYAECDNFYLQLITDALIMQDIIQCLQICQKQKSLSHNPYVGELVCAKSSLDNCWYRGTVQDLLPSCTFKVLFIDYGNTEELNKQSLQCMPESLMKFPLCCFPVKVTNVNALAKNVQLEKCYDIVVDTDSEIQDVRILEGLAANQDVNSNVEVVTEGINNIQPAKFQYSDRKQGVVSNGVHTIIITNITPVTFMLADKKFLVELDALTTSISEYIKQLQCTTYDGSDIEEGEMVLAEYMGDWYRACVSEILKPDDQSCLYEVFFIDYGNVEKVTKESLRSMNPKFMNFEVNTHVAELKGVNQNEINEALVRELESFKNMELEASVENTNSFICLSIPQITNTLLERNLINAT